MFIGVTDHFSSPLSAAVASAGVSLEKQLPGGCGHVCYARCGSFGVTVRREAWQAGWLGLAAVVSLTPCGCRLVKPFLNTLSSVKSTFSSLESMHQSVFCYGTARKQCSNPVFHALWTGEGHQSHAEFADGAHWSLCQQHLPAPTVLPSDGGLASFKGKDVRCADTLDSGAPNASGGRDSAWLTKLLDSLILTIPFPLFFHKNCPCTCIFRVIYVFTMIKFTFNQLFY